MKNLLFLFCICIVIFSCKKEETFTPIDFTHNYTSPIIYSSDTLDCPNAPDVFIALDNYAAPIFNPLNPNLIAYLHRPWNRNTYQLWTFNLKDGRKTKVTSKRVIAMDWGINNWIGFTTSDSDFWKVKADGSELTKLNINSNFTQFIKFNSNAKKIIVDRPASFSFGSDKIIFDLESQNIINLPSLEFEFFQTIDWKNHLLLFPTFNRIATYNLQTDLITKVDSIEDHTTTGSILNAQFTIDNDVFWNTKKAIYKTNRVTGERTTIKTYGTNEEVNFIDISLDKKTILLQKTDEIVLTPCTIRRRNYLAFIDIDGSNERQILIPE